MLLLWLAKFYSWRCVETVLRQISLMSVVWLQNCLMRRYCSNHPMVVSRSQCRHCSVVQYRPPGWLSRSLCLMSGHDLAFIHTAVVGPFRCTVRAWVCSAIPDIENALFVFEGGLWRCWETSGEVFIAFVTCYACNLLPTLHSCQLSSLITWRAAMDRRLSKHSYSRLPMPTCCARACVHVCVCVIGL